MDQWLDKLAKDSAHRLSRRQVFRRVAGGFGMAVLGVFGFPRRAKANESCVARVCEECCRTQFPKGGAERGECIRQCHERQGLCQPAVDLACPPSE